MSGRVGRSGRKPLPPGQRRNNRLLVALRDAEYDELQALARELTAHPTTAARLCVLFVLKQRALGHADPLYPDRPRANTPTTLAAREQVVDKHIARGVLRRQQREAALRACGMNHADLETADRYWSKQPEDRRG